MKFMRREEPILKCYILDDGRVMVGQSANLEKESHIEIEGGREKKVTGNYIYIKKGVFIPQAKLGDFTKFEKLRYDPKFKEKIINEYINSDDRENKVIRNIYSVIKPYTIFGNKNSFYENIKEEEYQDYLKMEEIRKEEKRKKTLPSAVNNLIKGENVKDRKSIYSYFSLGD